MNINNTAHQIFHWSDPVKTGAIGWVVIDSLVNGLSAGGLFMHPKATIDEVSDLARTMSFKNTLLEPIIGGAKAGIRFNHQDPRAPDVIRRFLLAHKNLLESCWYTGADLNTRNDFIFDVIEHELKLPSVFYSLGKMLNKRFGIPDQSALLRKRLSSPVGNSFTLETCSTGYSVATAIKLLSPTLKPRILIQGFGAVGSSLNYFLHLQDIATVVGIADIDGFIVDPLGISVEDILVLSDAEKSKYRWTLRLKLETDEAFLCRFLSSQTAEIFSPCATRYQLTQNVANTLLDKTFRHIPAYERFIISGANNAFRSEEVRILLENSGVHILPEWVSNCGNTILFMESMKEAPLDQNWNEYLFSVIHQRLKAFIHLENEFLFSINRAKLKAFIHLEVIRDHKNKHTLYENCSALAIRRLKNVIRKDIVLSDIKLMELEN